MEFAKNKETIGQQEEKENKGNRVNLENRENWDIREV